MWASVVTVLLAAASCRGEDEMYSPDQYLDQDVDDQEDDGLYDAYNNDEATTTDVLNRFKRYDDENNFEIRTLNPKEILDVKGALNKIQLGPNRDAMKPSPNFQDYTDIYDYAQKDQHIRDMGISNEEHVSRNRWRLIEYEDKTPIIHVKISRTGKTQGWSPKIDNEKYELLASDTTRSYYDMARKDVERLLGFTATRSTKSSTVTAQHWRRVDDALHETQTETEVGGKDNDKAKSSSSEYVRKFSPADSENWRSTHTDHIKPPVTAQSNTRDGIQDTVEDTTNNPGEIEQTSYDKDVKEAIQNMVLMREEANESSTTDIQNWNPVLIQNWNPLLVQNWNPLLTQNWNLSETHIINFDTTTPAQNGTGQKKKTGDSMLVLRDEKIAKANETTTEIPSTTKATTAKSTHLDINAIIAIIANLTYDYEWNLTEEFNRTLVEHGVPQCPTFPQPSTTSTTQGPYDLSNNTVIAKCFVCGLKDTEIPHNAYCADAFAGDFIPLVPVDPRARGQIAKFRKYCRYSDVPNYVENPSEPRSIYGRFTGGCAVRWTDLTGTYTQRTCRARFRPLMGKHFVSKRMAKLELSLINVENGCIITPMATLLPMSRGISLYARFHACVCTGNWCNRAVRAHSALYTTLLLYSTWILTS